MRSNKSSRSGCALEQLEGRQLLSAAISQGEDNDLVYDATNHTTWVAYFDPINQDLKVRSRADGGSWSAENEIDAPHADPLVNSSQVGRSPSIAIAPNGAIGIAYTDGDQADLKFVERDPTTGAWGAPQRLDPAGTTGQYPSLAYNTKSAPFISYWRNNSGTDYLKVMNRTGSSPVAPWTSPLVVDSGADVGRYSSIVVNATVGVGIAYTTGSDARYAQSSGSTYATTVVDATAASAYPSLAFDTSNQPWFSYYVSNGGSVRKVKVAKRTSTGWGTPGAVYGNNGYYTNLWFEPGSNDARLLFYDPNNVRVKKFNYTASTSSWQAETDPTTTLLAGGGDRLSAVRGAGGSITFTSLSSILTGVAPAVYQKDLQVRDQTDANLGKTWASVTQSTTSPAPATSGPTVLLNGVLYMIDQTSTAREDVWSSTDNGVTWSNLTAGLTNGPAFGQRISYSLTAFNGELWVVGGRSTIANAYLDDVWHSADGVTWTQAAAGAFPARSNQGTAVFNNRLYVIGGYYTSGGFSRRLDDVWSTADGVTWQADVASGAPFGKLDGMSVVSHAGRLWVIGGTVGGLSPVTNNVWSSADGQTWVQSSATVTGGSLPLRTGTPAFSFDNRLWMVGGLDSNFSLQSSIYYSLDGANWVLAGNLPTARSTSGAFVLNNQMWLVGGSTASGQTNDVSHSNP